MTSTLFPKKDREREREYFEGKEEKNEKLFEGAEEITENLMRDRGMGQIKEKTMSFIRICCEERKKCKSMERRNESEKLNKKSDDIGNRLSNQCERIYITSCSIYIYIFCK